MSQKPSLPKGMRDFGPPVMARRNYILDIIKGVFQKFGFMPLETPAMENLSTLTGKYGDEGDQLLFKVLESGDYLKSIKNEHEQSSNIKAQEAIKQILKDLCEGINKKGIESIEYEDIEKYYLDNIESIVLSNSSYIINQLEFLTDFFNQKSKEYSTLIHWHFIQISKYGQLNDEKFDWHFQQFVDDQITESIIPNYLAYQLKRNIFENKNYITSSISAKGLKYDLTVPFARFVVMNQNDITFPFKRYQIQPVWRADRPQRGRYREFYQCDADVVGTNSLICEAEIILMINEVFTNLGIKDYLIKINHRAMLTGIAEIIGAQGKESDLFVAIDKLDKIGLEKVNEELMLKGFTTESLTSLSAILSISGTFEEKVKSLKNTLSNSEDGIKGLQEIEQIIAYVSAFGSNDTHVELDTTLARGLSYYTGAIFEVKINNVTIGSVSGGGRYDDLTGIFGLDGTSGVGFSFGVDRLYDCLEELSLFKDEALIFSEVLIVHFDVQTQNYGLSVLSKLRNEGIKSEIYPDQAKLKKQFGYADKKGITYTIAIGSEELNSGKLTLKNMSSGEQTKLNIEEIIAHIKAQY